MNYVYFLLCIDRSIYCGQTKNLENRLKKHNKGTGAKYTRNRRPVDLLVSFPCQNVSEALKLEHKLKQLSRREKLELIKDKLYIDRMEFTDLKELTYIQGKINIVDTLIGRLDK